MGQQRKHSKEERARRDREVALANTILRLLDETLEIRIERGFKPSDATQLTAALIKFFPDFYNRQDQWVRDEFEERVRDVLWNHSDHPTRVEMMGPGYVPRFRCIMRHKGQKENLYVWADIPPSPNEGKPPRDVFQSVRS